jgi:dTDP-4-dehydrorhamnose reductase
MAAKVLVTGCFGQLGSEIKVIANSFSNLNFLFHDVDTLDITSKTSLIDFFKVNKPNYIINCAAYTAVDKAESEIEKAYLINSTAVANLVEACKTTGSKIIHISTDYVFDGKKNTPYNEDDAVNPISLYGKSKLEGELQLKNYRDVLIIRTAWLYSTFGNNIVKTIRKYGAERDVLKFIFDQVGSPTYAADLADAIIQIVDQCVKNPEMFIPGIYHYSNEGACSWYDFASEVVAQSKLSCKVLPIEAYEYPTPATRPVYSVFNKAKIKKTFGIDIPWWKDSLSRCIKAMK